MTMNRSIAQPQPAARCACCGYSSPDVRIKNCTNGCAYHARCLDLMSISRQSASAVPSSFNAHHVVSADTNLAELTSCPCCSAPSSGLEMIPLSLTEIDQAQRLSGYNNKGSSSGEYTAPPGKRMHVELMNGGNAQESSFYDPASPRTGKWSDEEIAFRDEMVPHFVEGSLPLPNGLKLIEFLSSVLKSKPSRLTKKMKHAKLSTRHFHLDGGYIRDGSRAKELSRLELAFVNSISDPVERSEIKFHMQREWRDHLAERLTYLRISFDAEEWLKSVDAMDRRITLAKSRHRMVKRRFMMGKAMEKDTSSPVPGVFIDTTNAEPDEVDFELLASALETNDAEDADLRALYSSMAQDTKTTGSTVSVDGSSTKGGVGGSSSSLHPSSAESPKPTPFRSALLPSLGSAEGPNFRFAAPFLAKITAYIEHNRLPFEHLDIWVPSSSDPVLDPTGATAPEPSLLGSGSSTNAREDSTERLCFAGSASVGVQILAEDAEVPDGRLPAPPFGHRSKPGVKVVPLSSDEIYHLSLFGSYSEKFSFSFGCGLPGRVFESAIPAWEQFIANAPSHLFERRGGAMQFGIKTALGLPIRSPNVGRIVLVLYSKHNREKDDELVAQMVRDFQSLNPCVRWKLMVDMGNTPNAINDAQQATVAGNVNRPEGVLTAVMAGLSEKNAQISSLISLLGENMPSDQSSQLGQQLHNIMSLRLVLLRTNRTPGDEQLVESIITLFESYVQAGRSRPDITLMLARDFAFHSIQHQQQQQPPMTLNNQASFQRQMFIPSMQHLSIGASIQQQEPSCQLDHNHHGQPSRNSAAAADRSQSMSYSESNGSTPDFQTNSKTSMERNQSIMTMNQGQSSASFSSMTERDYSTPVFQISPRSLASLNHLESKHHHVSLNEPPASLHF